MARKWQIVGSLFMIALLWALLAAPVALAQGPARESGEGVIAGMGHWRGHRSGWEHNTFLNAATDVLDMSRWRLRSELRDGATLAGLAQDEGVDPQDIVEAAREDLEDWLAWRTGEDNDPYYYGHYISEEQADWLRAELENHAPWVLENSAPLALSRASRYLIGFGWGYQPVMDAAEEALDMDHMELMWEMMDGATLAELADQEGIDPTDIVDRFLNDAERFLGDAVDDGDMTQAQMDYMMDEMADLAGWYVDNTFMMGGMGGMGGGGCH